MRNIHAHPLTNEEVLAWLERQEADFIASQRIGGMDGMIIHHLQSLAQAHPITTTDTTTTNS